ADLGRIDRVGSVARGERHVGLVVVQRGVGNEPAFLADLVHHAVTGVDAERAGDAFELLAVANVDAHRADGHAGVAVHAIAYRLAGGGGLLGVARAGLAAPVV